MAWIKNNTPVLGPWKRKISRIDRMAMVDCTPNPYAMVAGIAVAFFHVVWVVAGPECIDQAYDRRPGKKPHRAFKARGTPIQPQLPAPPGKYGNTMIAMGDMAQRIGLFFGLVDGALDGVYYGASMVRRYSGCVNTEAPYAELFCENSVPSLIPAQTFIMTQWQLDASHIYFTDSSGVAFAPSPFETITAMLSLTQGFNQFPPLADCSFTAELMWLPSGDPVQMKFGAMGRTLNGTGNLFGQDIQMHASDAFVCCKITKTEGVLFFTTGRFSVVGGKLGGNLAPYQCKAETSAFGPD